eukprot:217651-Amphidinium_carterae.2
MLDKLTSWERLMNEWERLSDSVKCSFLAERAPGARTHLFLNAGSLQDYDKMRAMLQQFTQADQPLPVPMESWTSQPCMAGGKVKVKAKVRTGRHRSTVKRETREAPAKERTKVPEANLLRVGRDRREIGRELWQMW